MKKSPLSDANRLRHMLDFAQKILYSTQHMTRETLANDELDLMGIIRLLELIGEVASRVSPEIQTQHPEIDWIGIIGM